MWRLTGVILTAVCALPAHAAGAVRWGGSLGITSDYVWRGVSQSHGERAWQAEVHVDPGAQWRFGVWASEVALAPDRNSAELDFYASRQWSVTSDPALVTSLTRYTYVNDPRAVSYTYHEASVGLNWRDAWSLSIAWSPDVALVAPPPMGILPHQQTLTVEGSYHGVLPLGLEWQLGAGVVSLPERSDGDYAYGSASLVRGFGPLRAELGWIYAPQQRQRLYFPGKSGGPWVLTLAYAFSDGR